MNALRALEFNEVTPQSLVHRHAKGDWGDAPTGHRLGNEQHAAAGQGVVTSRYRMDDGEIVVVTSSLADQRTLISQPGDEKELGRCGINLHLTLVDRPPARAVHFLVAIRSCTARGW
jgi:hypothetical protein